MKNDEVVSFITPFVKSMKIKKINDLHEKVLLLNNTLICTDSENGSLSIMDIGINTDTILSGFMDDLTLFPERINYNIYQELLSYYNYYASINSWDIEQEQMELDENFMAMVSSKAGDGLQRYFMNDLFIPIFYGLVPAAKSDKISLSVKDMGDHNIIRYTVYKKKFKTNMFIYLKLLKVR